MSKVKYALENGVALIALNDPDTLNAIDPEVSGALAEAFARAAGEARAAVLTGEGRAFCSGAKLGGSGPPLGSDGQADVGSVLEKHYNPFVTALRDLPIPF